MAVICTSNMGWLISHSDYISRVYEDLQDSGSISLRENLFKISSPYKKRNSTKKLKISDDSVLATKKNELMTEKEVNNVQFMYNSMYHEFKTHFSPKSGIDMSHNIDALKLSEWIYEETGRCSVENAEGMNIGPSTIKTINDFRFLFPKNCKFFSRDIEEMSKYLVNDKFDLILLDPPWWNKYIRRKRKKTSHAYKMMYNNDLKELKLENFLSENGLVVVWCTNSLQHINALKDDIFPKWGVKFISKWYWLKITQSGEPICNFSCPPGKQPFEQIIFGCRNERELENPPNEKIVVSVPSALHSHKPPLADLLKFYVPNESRCLELFARYLLPSWTSYGNEVLKFQHESLYDIDLGYTDS